MNTYAGKTMSNCDSCGVNTYSLHKGRGEASLFQFCEQCWPAVNVLTTDPGTGQLAEEVYPRLSMKEKRRMTLVLTVALMRLTGIYISEFNAYYIARQLSKRVHALANWWETTSTNQHTLFRREFNKLMKENTQ